MRLLHIADVHLERPFTWLGPDRGRKRRAELRATLARVVAIAREQNVDALCIAGDLFERENSLPALGEFLAESFGRLGDVPVLISPGDRDYYRRGCLYDQVSWPANVQIFRSATLSPVPVRDGTVWGCAFEGPDQRSSPLAGLAISDRNLHVGLFHADVDGDATGLYAPINPRDIVGSGLRFAMLGHVHAGRWDEQHSFAYPGSLEPLDSSEAGPRGAILLDITNSSLRVEWIPVAQRQVLFEEIDISTISTIAEFRRQIARRQPAWEHALVSLRLVGVLNGELEDTDAIRLAFRDELVDLTIVGEPQEDLTGLARQETTLGGFVRTVGTRIDGAVDDENRRYWSRVLRVGARAFRGREVAQT